MVSPSFDTDAVDFLSNNFKFFQGVADEKDFALRGKGLIKTLRSRLETNKIVTMGDFYMALGMPGFTAVTGGDLLTPTARKVVVSVKDNIPFLKEKNFARSDYWSKTSSDLFLFRRQFQRRGVTYHYDPGEEERENDIIIVSGEMGSGKTYFALGEATTEVVGKKYPKDTLSSTFFLKLGENGILDDLENEKDEVVATKITNHVKSAMASFGYSQKLDMRVNVVVDRANRAGSSLWHLQTLKSIMEDLKKHVATHPRLIVADCGILASGLSNKDVYHVRMGTANLGVMLGLKEKN